MIYKRNSTSKPSMKSRKETIDSLQIRLKNFVMSTVTKEDFDVVIPIMRKGLFLLETSFPKNRRFRIYLLDPIEDKLPRNIVLANKKILLLDDSARTGGTIERAKKSIIANNKATEEYIRVGVFMKHKDCKAKIDYPEVVFDDANGTELYGQLSDFFDSMCHQLDPDHMIICGKMKRESGTIEGAHLLACIRKELEQLGSYYPQESVCSLWGRTKFSVADLYASDFGLDAFKRYWRKEGVFKVRFCLEPNWTMYMVPIFCPEIVPPKFRDGSECGALVDFKFCEWSESPDEILCRDCISYGLTKVFADKFVPIFESGLQAQGYSYEISEATWPEIQLKYETFEDKILADLQSSKFRAN